MPGVLRTVAQVQKSIFPSGAGESAGSKGEAEVVGRNFATGTYLNGAFRIQLGQYQAKRAIQTREDCLNRFANLAPPRSARGAVQ